MHKWMQHYEGLPAETVWKCVLLSWYLNLYLILPLSVTAGLQAQLFGTAKNTLMMTCRRNLLKHSLALLKLFNLGEVSLQIIGPEGFLNFLNGSTARLSCDDLPIQLWLLLGCSLKSGPGCFLCFFQHKPDRPHQRGLCGPVCKGKCVCGQTFLQRLMSEVGMSNLWRTYQHYSPGPN